MHVFKVVLKHCASGGGASACEVSDKMKVGARIHQTEALHTTRAQSYGSWENYLSICSRLQLLTVTVVISTFFFMEFFRGRPRGGDNFTSLFQVLQTLYSKRQKHPFLPYELRPCRGHPVKHRLIFEHNKYYLMQFAMLPIQEAMQLQFLYSWESIGHTDSNGYMTQILGK